MICRDSESLISTGEESSIDLYLKTWAFVSVIKLHPPAGRKVSCGFGSSCYLRRIWARPSSSCSRSVCNVFLGCITHDPRKRHLFLLREIFESLVEIGRKAYGGTDQGCAPSLCASSLSLFFLHRVLPLYNRRHHTTPRR